MRQLAHEYAFVVIGGGLAGLCAAVTAAREGIHTALIQDRPVLGGNAGKEIRIPPVGATHCNFAYARETGLIEEIYLENLYRNPTGSYEGWNLSLENIVKNETNLSCFLNTHIDSVKTKGNRLSEVSGYTLGSETRHVFKGDLFADCTGDATVGMLAGAPYRWGVEARGEFGESMCDPLPQKHSMGCSIQMHARDAGRPMPFMKPSWVDLELSESDFGPHRDICTAFMEHKGGFWWLEWGGELDTVHETEQIKDRILTIIYAAWDYLKNRSSIKDAILNYELDWVGTIPGKRESRRLEGEYILSQRDIENQVEFEDAVAFGGWGFDDHPKEGFFSSKPSYHVYHAGPYNIPLRCLYSRTAENLFMAGRNISATHFGLSSTRVMLTCSQLGEAVGMAAAYCVRDRVIPRALVETGRVRQVQKSLAARDHHIHDLPFRDEADLAPVATVTASSTLTHVAVDNPSGRVSLDTDRLWQFPLASKRLSRVELLLDVAEDTTLQARLYRGASNGSTYPAPDGCIAHMPVPVTGGERQWVGIDFNTTVENPGWHFLEIGKNEAVKAWFGENPPVGCAGYTVRPDDPIRPNPFSRWDLFRRNAQVRKAYCMRIAPDQDIYGPSQVANAWSRPARLPNLWISKHTEFTKPEWLRFDWETEREISRIDLLFDSSLDFTFFQSWEGYDLNVLPSIVRDYRIDFLGAAEGKDSWQPLVQVTGNYFRLRRHEFPKIRSRAIRMLFTATNGIERAQVYAVRIY